MAADAGTTPHDIVRRASEYLRTHPSERPRIRDLSRASGISERAFRTAFHREHGVSPKQYEIRERLRAAREALRDVQAGTVTAIASQYGFSELGRFAGIYKTMFGESPSETMKAQRRRRVRST